MTCGTPRPAPARTCCGGSRPARTCRSSAELPDGSWLTHINDPAAVRARAHKNGQRRRRGSTLPPETGPLPGITVRVIQYVLTVTTEDGRTRTERYRLITTLTDWRACPAAELAACYAWRWAIETGYRECKTYLRGPGRILRGRTPALARQELWAYLAVYQAIRAIIVRAAAGAGLDPDRISFTATLNAAQRTMTAGPAASPPPWPRPKPRSCPAWSPRARAASVPGP